MNALDALWSEFEAMQDRGEPARTQEEFRAFFRATGLKNRDLERPGRKGAFWRLAFGDDGEHSWARGAPNTPTPAQWAQFRADIAHPPEADE